MVRFVVQFLLALLILAGISTVHAAGLEDGLAAYNLGDFSRARHCWAPLARRGDATAQYYMGYLYQAGKGVKPDAATAYRWFRKSATAGNRLAQYQLLNAHAQKEIAVDRVNIASL